MSIKAITEQKDVGMNIHQVSFRTYKKHQSFGGGKKGKAYEQTNPKRKYEQLIHM